MSPFCGLNLKVRAKGARYQIINKIFTKTMESSSDVSYPISLKCCPALTFQQVLCLKLQVSVCTSKPEFENFAHETFCLNGLVFITRNLDCEDLFSINQGSRYKLPHPHKHSSVEPWKSVYRSFNLLCLTNVNKFNLKKTREIVCASIWYH